MKEENNSQLSILNSPLIPPGYKQTEVGVIPEDWKITTLKTLMRPERKITYGIVVPGPIVHNGVPIIRAQDYSKGWVDLDELYRVSPKIDQSYKRSRVITGDILLTIVGSVGNLAKVPNLFDGSNLTQQTARLSFNTKTANADYFLNILHSKIGKREISNYTKSGVQPSLNLSDVEQFLVPLPTLPEQEAIAKALSDADALIESLEQLLAKKRQIKQGAMQELLTGKKRLPGFEVKRGYKETEVGMIPEDWNLDYIENLSHITTGGRNTQDRIEDGLYPFFVRSQTVERINSYSFEGEAVLTAGDGVGTGKVFHYINGKFDAHQRVYRISDFSDQINGYFFYLYFSSHFYGRIMQMTAKSSVDSVRREMIAKMLVPLPPTKTEQTAIAAILSDMDAEIAALEAKLAKTRQLKQGMMQELLTGKIRLI